MPTTDNGIRMNTFFSAVKALLLLLGLNAVLAMALAPFVRLGAFYLALRLAGAIGADAVSKAHAGLISNLASAMGYMLAIAASTLWMSLVSSACFLKAVGG